MLGSDEERRTFPQLSKQNIPHENAYWGMGLIILYFAKIHYEIVRDKNACKKSIKRILYYELKEAHRECIPFCGTDGFNVSFLVWNIFSRKPPY